MQSLPFFIVSLCRLRFRFSICAPAIPGRHLAPMPDAGRQTVPFLRRRMKYKTARIVEFPTDRTVISTENNGFAGDERDETLIDENLVETEIPLADRIPGAVRETEEGDRPIYDEEGYRNDPGGE